MRDDVLDLTSDEATLGKPVGNDLRERKMTVPSCWRWPAEIGIFAPTSNATSRRTTTRASASRVSSQGSAPKAGSRKPKPCSAATSRGRSSRSRRSETRPPAPNSSHSPTHLAGDLVMLGTTEIALIVGAAILLFGVDKLPKLARSAGQAKKEFMVGQAEADLAAERARDEARNRAEMQAAEHGDDAERRRRADRGPGSHDRRPRSDDDRAAALLGARRKPKRARRAHAARARPRSRLGSERDAVHRAPAGASEPAR